MHWRGWSRAAILIVVVLPWLYAVGTAQTTERAEAERTTSPWHWELNGGYGYGVDMSSEATYLGNVRFVGLAPRVGRTLEREYFRERWFEGNVHLLVEVPLWVSLEPERGFAAGSTLLARYLFAAPERLRPFGEIGAGPVYLGFDNERNQADGFSFTLQAGGGLMYRLTRSWVLAIRADLHHISNAGLRKPNPGINGLLFTVGIARRAP